MSLSRQSLALALTTQNKQEQIHQKHTKAQNTNKLHVALGKSIKNTQKTLHKAIKALIPHKFHTYYKNLLHTL